MKCLTTLAALVNLIFISSIQSQGLQDSSAKNVSKGVEEGSGRNVSRLDLVEPNLSGNNSRNTKQNQINSDHSNVETGTVTERNYSNGDKSNERDISHQNMEVLGLRNSNSGLLGNVFGYFTGMLQGTDDASKNDSTDSHTDSYVKSPKLTDDVSDESITQADNVAEKGENLSPKQDVNSDSRKEMKVSENSMNPENPVESNNIESNSNMPSESSSNLITDIGSSLFNKFISNSKDDSGIAKTILNTLIPNPKDNSGISKATVNSVIQKFTDNLGTAEVAKEDGNSDSFAKATEAEDAQNPEATPEFGKNEKPMHSTYIESNSNMPSESSSNLITDIGSNLLNTFITNSKDDSGAGTNLLNTFIPDSKDSLSVATNLLNTLIPDSKDGLDSAKTPLKHFIPDSKDNAIGVAKNLLNTFIPSGKDDKGVEHSLLNSLIPDSKDITLGVAKSLLNTFIPSSKDSAGITTNILNKIIPNSKNVSGVVGNTYDLLSKLFEEKTYATPPKKWSSLISDILYDLVSKLIKGKYLPKRENKYSSDVQHDRKGNQKQEQVQYDMNLNQNQAQSKPASNFQTNPDDFQHIVLPENVSTKIPTIPPHYENLLKEINQNIRVIGEHVTKNTQTSDKVTSPEMNYENYNNLNIENGQISSQQACSSNLFDLAFRPPGDSFFNLALRQGSGSNSYTPNIHQKPFSLACSNPPCIVRFCPEACACPLYCSNTQQVSCPCCPPCDPYPHYLYPQCR